MPSGNMFFEESFKIRASEINRSRKATLPAVCDLLQEIAGNQARRLNFDITDLQRNNLTWVLYRLQLHMDRFPGWREQIKIRTWPSGSDGLRAHRDFLIMDEEGQTIGKAISYWLILDIKTRRPQRVPASLTDSIPENAGHVIPVSKPRFPKIDEPDLQHSFNVRPSDLDINRHVNNVRYIEWMTDCLPGAVNPKKIDINFVGEAVQNDTLWSSCIKNDQNYCLQIQRPDDGQIMAKARIS